MTRRKGIKVESIQANKSRNFLAFSDKVLALCAKQQANGMKNKINACLLFVAFFSLLFIYSPL